MTSFQGYEVVPAEGMARHSRSIIRITVILSDIFDVAMDDIVVRIEL